MTDRDTREHDEPTPAYQALAASSIGLEMALAIGVGWGIGYWLDGRLGTGPWLMVVFLGCGIAAACKPLIRVSRQAKRRAGESNQTGAGEG